jgi:FlaA1/EpsC-like NDP-sugar epimerase
MQLNFNAEEFISENITKRKESLFSKDLEVYHSKLSQSIEGKNVLVIGGAGTIGSSYIKALIKYKPAKLIVVDVNENGLTELVRDCRSNSHTQLPPDFKSYPLDFGDKVFKKIFGNEGPFHIVANFAAHKHVRSEKDVYSIEAMINNNVFKAKHLLDMLVENPPEHFFCVSTDKAANPVNVMGASKKLMEDVILAYSSVLKITTARFANVAFSNGSLLDGFIRRTLLQQPLACPSDVKRFFVSPTESGQICLLACMLGSTGDILFPKLYEKDMVNFASIVEPFLNALGYEMLPCKSEQEARDNASKIKSGIYPVYFFSSDTSGEKLFEEFYTEEEKLDLKSFHSLGIVKDSNKRSITEVGQVIQQIENLFSSQTEKLDVINLLRSLLPGFNHIETGLQLDQKM